MIEKYLLLLHTLHPPPFHSRPSSTQTHSQVLRHFTDSGLYTDLFVITLVIKQIGLPLRHPTRVQTEFESTQSHTIINRTPLSPVLAITYQLPNTINHYRFARKWIPIFL